MNGITHKQAQKYVRLDLDGLLTDDQRRDLETHLSGCEACRADAQAFSTLTSRLQSGFRSRWDAQNGPSKNVMATVRSQTRRIIMSNKVNWGLRTLGGIAALLLLGFGLNIVFSRLRDNSIAANETAIPDNNMPVSTQAEKRLLAFTKEVDGNLDIYTIHADGSGLTNLTNSHEQEANPYWSPDGMHIAFNGSINGQQQIFMMDADGTNVVQLTEDGSDNKLVSFEEGRDSEFNLWPPDGFDAWSPDGKRLVFVKMNASRKSDGQWMKLYVLDVETKTQTPLTGEWGAYLSPAWSPDGEHIAFTSYSRFNAQGEPTGYSVHVVGADGNNLLDLTASLPEDEYALLQYWSSDGQSVFIRSFKIPEENSKIYEARLDGSLVENSYDNALLIDLWDGTALTTDSARSNLIWLRPDGTRSTLNVCPSGLQIGNFSPRRSNSETLFFGVQCTSGELRLYLANKDGRVIQELLDKSLPAEDGVMADQSWSPDDNFIAFNVSSNGSDSDKMYILNVAENLADPSIQPVLIEVGKVFPSANSSVTANSITWQPVLTEQDLVVEEKPTPIVEAPEPSPQTADSLIAFTSAVENGNLDIYTIYPDGSGLTDLTNDPAHDVNPYWSPDGKRIAFMSDRTGFMQIFIMNADGSDVIQLTNNEANHEFGVSDHGPWSPDGSRLLFTEWAALNEKWMLYTVDVNGENKTPIAEVPNIYTSPSWSPDGQHIAYIITETVEDREMARIHVVGADGRNDTNVTSQLPEDVDLSSLLYSWTQEGNIRFAANRVYVENDSLDYTLYEVTIDGATLVELAHTSTGPGDIWNGTTFVAGATTLNWLRPDGSYQQYQPFEKCQMGSDPQYGSMFKRSSHGYLIFAANCPNGDWWFTWVNPQGTQVKQLLDYPISTQPGITHMNWSSDDRYIAINLTSSDVTYLYVINVEAALKDPSTQPVKIPLAGGEQYYNISWQPIP